MSSFYDTLRPGHDYHSVKQGNVIQRYWHAQKFGYMRQSVNITPEMVVVDVGCGSGAFLETLPPCQKHGVDHSVEQLAFARKLGLTVVQSEADALPFSDGSVDVVFSSELIEHIPREKGEKMIEEFYRILRPGGKVVLTTPNYYSLWPAIEELWSRTGPIDYRKIHITHYTRKKITNLFRENGFQKMRVKTFFLISPFLCFVPVLAKWVSVIENKLINRGALLWVVAQK